jgi:hypothetical protein
MHVDHDHHRQSDICNWGAGDGLLFQILTSHADGAVVSYAKELGRCVVRQGLLLSAAAKASSTVTSSAPSKATAIVSTIVAACDVGRDSLLVC